MNRPVSRAGFLAVAAAAHMASFVPSDAQALPALPAKLKRSLVLSGGGALGAYEAGAVQALVEAAGLGEGQPLSQYGVVTGTSIGAFNAFLVATAQWSKLAGLWSSITSQNVVRPKPQFAKIANQSSGVINRFAQALSLGLGAGKNVLGIYDGDYLQSWLETYLDFSKPIVTPLVWAVTNLTDNFPEYFYLLPPNFGEARTKFALDSIRLSVGRFTAVREADPALLPKQLRASAAVPVAFDPVWLPGPKGSMDQYVDGGVTANTPIAVARAVSSAVDAVVLAPPFDRQTYHDMFEVTSGSFGTMQRRLMFDALQTAVLETYLFRSVRSMSDADLAVIAQTHGYDPREIRIFANLLADTQYFVLRPHRPLPATLFGFDDAAAIRETYAAGLKDGSAGFAPFDFTTVQLGLGLPK